MLRSQCAPCFAEKRVERSSRASEPVKPRQMEVEIPATTGTKVTKTCPVCNCRPVRAAVNSRMCSTCISLTHRVRRFCGGSAANPVLRFVLSELPDSDGDPADALLARLKDVASAEVTIEKVRAAQEAFAARGQGAHAAEAQPAADAVPHTDCAAPQERDEQDAVANEGTPVCHEPRADTTTPSAADTAPAAVAVEAADPAATLDATTEAPADTVASDQAVAAAESPVCNNAAHPAEPARDDARAAAAPAEAVHAVSARADAAELTPEALCSEQPPAAHVSTAAPAQGRMLASRPAVREQADSTTNALSSAPAVTVPEDAVCDGSRREGSPGDTDGLQPIQARDAPAPEAFAAVDAGVRAEHSKAAGQLPDAFPICMAVAARDVGQAAPASADAAATLVQRAASVEPAAAAPAATADGRTTSSAGARTVPREAAIYAVDLPAQWVDGVEMSAAAAYALSGIRAPSVPTGARAGARAEQRAAHADASADAAEAEEDGQMEWEDAPLQRRVHIESLHAGGASGLADELRLRDTIGPAGAPKPCALLLRPCRRSCRWHVAAGAESPVYCSARTSGGCAESGASVC